MAQRGWHRAILEVSSHKGYVLLTQDSPIYVFAYLSWFDSSFSSLSCPFPLVFVRIQSKSHQLEPSKSDEEFDGVRILWSQSTSLLMCVFFFTKREKGNFQWRVDGSNSVWWIKNITGNKLCRLTNAIKFLMSLRWGSCWDAPALNHERTSDKHKLGDILTLCFQSIYQSSESLGRKKPKELV